MRSSSRSAKSTPGLSLPSYIESFRNDIQDNLLKEVFKQDKYQEHCVDLFVKHKGDNRSDGFPAYRLAECRYSAILGEAGSGKTTTLRLLALDLLEAQRMQVLPLRKVLKIYFTVAIYVPGDYGFADGLRRSRSKR